MPSCAAQPCDVDVEDHGYKDGDAEDDVVGVGAYALQGEAVAEDGEDQRPEERASNGPDPTEQRRPPYDRSGDAEQHDVGSAGERVYGVYAEGLDDADETAKHPQSMKLPILMRATPTPASLAPSRLPPVA